MPSFLPQLRKTVFWSLDFLKGAPIRNHVKDIRKTLWHPDRAKGERKTNLSKLLTHAVETTPFYQKFKTFPSLEDFPIIDKNLILNNYDDFKSTSFLNATLYKASSSGSTGIPFSIFQDKRKRDRNTADVIHFSEAVDSYIGDKLIYIKLWDHTNKKHKWIIFFQNILPHSVMDSSSSDLHHLLSAIESDRSTKNMLGYPSFFEEICNYLDQGEDHPKISGVNSIISFGENLKEHERKRMQKYFRAPVFERYSNQENGILAQQTKKSNGRYVLNWASYHFEILELDSDQHVKPGCLGRIVVTDLFNYAMPMIRYDTGDMAVYEEPQNGYPYFSKIYGRRMDTVYNSSGEIVSPFIFYMVLEYAKVKQFQFIQKGKKEYRFKLNGKPQNVDEEGAIRYFRNYLGEDAIITFEYVEEIPLLSSGKRKKIVNEYMPRDGQ
ncbi:MAG: CoF synthetase [Allomuricauda sp.]